MYTVYNNATKTRVEGFSTYNLEEAVAEAKRLEKAAVAAGYDCEGMFEVKTTEYKDMTKEQQQAIDKLDSEWLQLEVKQAIRYGTEQQCYSRYRKRTQVWCFIIPVIIGIIIGFMANDAEIGVMDGIFSFIFTAPITYLFVPRRIDYNANLRIALGIDTPQHRLEDKVEKATAYGMAAAMAYETKHIIKTGTRVKK